jgi:hypothetical protein
MVQGIALLLYLSTLDAAAGDDFLEAYTAEIAHHYPPRFAGRFCYDFRGCSSSQRDERKRRGRTRQCSVQGVGGWPVLDGRGNDVHCAVRGDVCPQQRWKGGLDSTLA